MPRVGQFIDQNNKDKLFENRNIDIADVDPYRKLSFFLTFLLNKVTNLKLNCLYWGDMQVYLDLFKIR